MRMFKLIAGAGCFLLAMSVLSVGVVAEDIDLFSGINPSGGNPPTVLLGWHSTANSNANVVHGCVYSDTNQAPELGDTVGGMEQCALVNTMLSLKNANSDLLGAVKVGLMVFNENGFSGDSDLGNGNNRCGYLYSSPALMTEPAINSFVSKLKAFDKNDLANQSRLGDLVAESWAMLNGLSTSCSGVDYSGLAEVATECRDAVLVYIGNATKENSSVADGTGNPDTLLLSQLSSAFGYAEGSSKYEFFSTPRAVTLLNNSGSANNKYWGDEWTRFMNLVDVGDSAQSDRNITTYSIAVYAPDLEEKLAGEINFLADMATEGGGKAFKVTADNHAGLQEILIQIFNEVQDVNSVFSSATLPVSANTQGTFLNQVYIAMFRPDATAGPRWNGNVKQYQLGFDAGGNIVLTDATQDVSGAVTSVTNPVTGAIASTATSFWTTNSPTDGNGVAVANWPAGGFWINSPEGDAFTYDAPDGDLVEKGGVGLVQRIQNLTSSDGRIVYTCNDTGACPTGSALPDFDGDNATLVSKLEGILGAAQAGGGASITVGRYDTNETISTSCSGNGNNRKCTVTHDNSGGTDLDANTDRVVIVGGWNSVLPANKQVCTFDAPCSISGVTDSTFDVTSKDIPNNGSYNNAVIVDVSRLATVSQTGHGLLVGDQIELENCTVGNNTNTYNIDELEGTVLGSVAAIIDDDTYQLTLQDYVLAETANVTCGTSAVTLTADNLIQWMRGDDIVGNEVKRGPCPPNSRDAECPVSVRGSIHGDVLHSRPAVINYGGNTGVVVFYGSNDGHFRAINGNQTANIGDVQPGGELWSFVAPEFFDQLKRLYNNNPAVKYPTSIDPDAEGRDYFFDGTTTVLQDQREGTSTSGKAYIYLSARRGGRFIYAMDVTTPTSPRYLWRLTTSDLPELGQTWSQPKVTQIKGYDNPVLVFGAGYDPAEDADPASGTNTMGRGIVIVDSVSGKILWTAVPSCAGVTLAAGGHCQATASLTRAIPADITLVDRDFDGFTDRLYAADVGGNIWRIDLETQDPADTAFSQFQISKLAELGGSGNNARKFLFGPDVVPTNNFDAVVAVSGDREHPLYTDDNTAGRAYNVQNRFYVIMDKNLGKAISSPAPDPIDTADLVNQSSLQCLDADENVVSCDTAGATSLFFDGLSDSYAGYYINLMVGEKGVNAPLTVGGKVYFGTNQPDVPAEGSCTANLGNAGAYVIDLFTGETQRNIFSGGGLPPSPIAGLVTIDGKTVPFIIGGAGPSPFDPSMPEMPADNRRERTFWYFK
ncbi:hypothetical protein I6N98_11595 [Spongiibacter nanhainus]|uniref:PilY1 beta-propeller domain-containing protein n=1 Tax=Spongiibacter nanhainus TaxID=2794344 RepID=A0A7T4QYH2_9GAMM|nr:PilC/PilY family type IV pilus protein [Spongiibacter nanhainus]QQD17022.1 hypothetical protein I6N98_11595 [Spongiibacter nanhainus]